MGDRMDGTCDDEKLAELLLCLADRLADQPAAGSTKLNKLMFFSEFAHVREHGRPITGAEYQRLAHGPAPRRLVPIRDRLLEAGDAELRDEVFVGRVQERLVPRRTPDLSRFTETELATINEVVDQLGKRTETELSDLSHREPAWNLVAEGETIPYETAFLRPGPAGPRVHARDLAARQLPR